jgi:hypothetical protein
VPFDTTVKVSALPSTSLPVSVPPAALSSCAISVPEFATGSSFTASIVTVTVATFESALPSFTLKVNKSDPLTCGFGV